MLALAATLIAVAAMFDIALRSAHASAPTPLLPNLVAEAPNGQEYRTEAFEGQTRLLLKFNGYIHNKGPGAIDIRGERERGAWKKSTEEKVLRDKERSEETLEAPEREELTKPAMKASQREFFPSTYETNIEREHVEEPRSAELIYSSADGHDHWHLQHIARYSLWDASREHEVTIGQKVGFCLDDGLHTEPEVGPSTPVYSNNTPPYQRFCKRFEPDATSLYEGISAGWSDVYASTLAWQWVDVSDVVPGEYWLREDVDPEDNVQETAEPNLPAWSHEATIVPGYDADPQNVSVAYATPTTITLASTEWVTKTKVDGVEETPGPVEYQLAAEPAHGKLVWTGSNRLTYTPEAGYSGPDEFKFTARDSDSSFPWNPLAAAVSLQVGANPSPPGVAITTAPTAMTAGTSAQLSAVATNDSGGIEWSVAPDGSVSSTPPGESAALTAPSSPGTLTVTARLADDHAVSSSTQVAVQAAPPSGPAIDVPEGPEGSSPPGGSSPAGEGSSGAGASSSGAGSASHGENVTRTGGPPASGVAGLKTVKAPPGVSRPIAMFEGRELIMTTTSTAGGRLRLSAWLGRHALGHCEAPSPGGRPFTCRIHVAKSVLREKIEIVASLTEGHSVFVKHVGPERVPPLRMAPMGVRAKTAGGGFWCSPSELVPTLESG